MAITKIDFMRNIDKLKKNERISRQGGKRFGYWNYINVTTF